MTGRPVNTLIDRLFANPDNDGNHIISANYRNWHKDIMTVTMTAIPMTTIPTNMPKGEGSRVEEVGRVGRMGG